MKRSLVALLVALLSVLALVACGAQAADSSGVANATTETQLPALTRLLVGTLQLEDTTLAVTAEQAQTLLPLWKMARSLAGSDSTAQAEIQALGNQIEEAMTAAQVGEIEALGLSATSAREAMANLGLRATTASGDTSGQSSSSAQVPQGDPGAGGGAGGPPDGGEGRPMVDGAAAVDTATSGATGAGQGGAMLEPLYDALVTMLTERAATLS